MKRNFLNLKFERLLPQWRQIVVDYFNKLNKIRSGSAVSRVFRHAFEHKHSKRFLGSNLAILMLASSFVPSVSSFNGDLVEFNVYAAEEASLSTNVTVRKPLKHLYINQGYHYFHPGIDYDGVIGEPVYPIMDGFVERVERSPYAYGNSIVVNHRNGYVSRYAHLSKINVFINQEIDVFTVIGDVGSTGRSTGAHLHIEVLENGRNINPLSIIPRE